MEFEHTRFNVTNRSEYERILDMVGDAPDQVHIHGHDEHENTVQFQEMWTGRGEGRFGNASPLIIEQLVENALSPAP